MGLRVIYDRDVKKIIGQDTFDVICKYASTGHINSQRMTDIAVQLHANVGGEHLRRCERSVPDAEPEMRSILADWYEIEMHQLRPIQAIRRLISIFEDGSINLGFIAKELREKLKKEHDQTEPSQDVVDATSTETSSLLLPMPITTTTASPPPPVPPSMQTTTMTASPIHSMSLSTSTMPATTTTTASPVQLPTTTTASPSPSMLSCCSFFFFCCRSCPCYPQCKQQHQ